MASVGNAGSTAALSGSVLTAVTRDITFGTYATGGEAITAAQVGLGTIFAAHATIKSPAGSVVSVYYDVANSKFKAFTVSAEVANATSLASLVCEVIFFGTR